MGHPVCVSRTSTWQLPPLTIVHITTSCSFSDFFLPCLFCDLWLRRCCFNLFLPLSRTQFHFFLSLLSPSSRNINGEIMGESPTRRSHFPCCQKREEEKEGGVALPFREKRRKFREQLHYVTSLWNVIGCELVRTLLQADNNFKVPSANSPSM